MHHNILVVANDSTQVTGTKRHFDQLVSVETYNPTPGLRDSPTSALSYTCITERQFGKVEKTAQT